MATFQVGSKVIMRDTQKKGIISQVVAFGRGRQCYIVDGVQIKRRFKE